MHMTIAAEEPCDNANHTRKWSLTDMRWAGSYTNMAFMRSIPSGSRLGNTLQAAIKLRGTHHAEGCLMLGDLVRGHEESQACQACLAAATRTLGAPLQRLRLPVGKLVPVPELAHAWPHLLIGRPQQLEYMQQLLQFTVAGE